MTNRIQDPSRLVALCLSGLMLLASCSTPSIVATQSIQKGDAMNNLNRYDEAIIHYQEYLRVSPQLGVYRNPSMEASVCRRLAHAYSTQGKYTQSLNYLNKALGIDSTIATNGLELVEDYRQIGLVHAYMGNFRTALSRLEKSLELNRGMERSTKGIKQSSIADTYLALARLNLTLGNYDLADQNATAALRLYEKQPDGSIGRMESQLILGIVARDKGNLKQATPLVESSLRLAAQNKFNTGRQLQALGEIYLLQGEIEEGIRYKTQAVDEAEKSNIKPQIIIAHMRLGDAFMGLGDKKSANANYAKALEIQSKISEGDTVSYRPMGSGSDIQKLYDFQMQSGSSIGAGLVSLRLGEILYSNNQYDSALTIFEQARTYFDKAGNKEGIARSALNLGQVMTTMGRYPEAASQLNSVLQNTLQPDLKWQAYYEIGVLKEALEDVPGARVNYEKSLDIIESMRANLSIEEFKTAFANNKTDVYDKLILLLVTNRENWSDLSAPEAVTRSFELNELARSRSFLDLLGNKKVEPKQSSDTLLLAREQLLRLKIVQLVQEINRTNSQSQSHSQLSTELALAQKEHTDILQRIKLNNPAYATVISVEPPPLPEVQASLGASTCIVEYWVSNHNLVIWTITQKSLDVKVQAIDRAVLQREVKTARGAIALKLQEAASESLSTLYGYLIKPIETTLDTYENVIVVPHQSLHFLPFQALQANDGKFLIQKNVIEYAPSASVFHYCMSKKPENGNRFLGAALGDMPVGHMPGLPGTELEVNQLSKIYGNLTKRTRQQLTESSFKNEVSDFNYVLVATHGILNKDQPLYSYLLMAESNEDDGRLTVNEIFGLDIKSKVVTLSACETGLGDLSEGDELVGLSRAFIYAGSSSVIVSLWKVDDATTSWLMTRFHQYLNGGATAGQSITYAQRDLLSRNFSGDRTRGFTNVDIDPKISQAVTSKSEAVARNPYYWAPFILIGNGFIK